MKTTKSKGFTLIELLVVIAIIGILAAIVLASLSTARSKANAAKVTGQLDEMRNAAEIYYSTASSYGSTVTSCSTGIFADTASGMSSLASSTNSAVVAGGGTMDCGANSTGWSAAAALPGGGIFCVDSTGAARSSASTTGVAYTAVTGATTAAHGGSGTAVCN